MLNFRFSRRIETSLTSHSRSAGLQAYPLESGTRLGTRSRPYRGDGELHIPPADEEQKGQIRVHVETEVVSSPGGMKAMSPRVSPTAQYLNEVGMR